MGTRLLAASVLAGSALVAWGTITISAAARLLQAGIALSIVYVAYLAWRGAQAIRAALRESQGNVNRERDASITRPFVSVVVPARNESAVIGSVIGDLAAQRYATGDAARFEVLLLDDGSTDDTAAVALAAAQQRGLELRVVRRDAESGPRTKGAALAHAMPSCRGEIVAAIDADSRIEPDLLDHVARAWQRDPRAAALQIQRRPWNSGASWLTAAQADEQLMDLASQCGRMASDGTAELRGNGMFVRRVVLERVGGWSTRALTEDLDLSTRLAGVGERVTLAPEAMVSEEAVEDLGALWQQRMRWAEGSLRRLMEHGPRLLVGRLPLKRKADFAAFTGEFLLPPLFVTTIVASLITIPLPRPADWTVPASLFAAYGLGSFLLAFAGLAATGVPGAQAAMRGLRGALFLSHWLVVVPAALLRIALLPRRSAFVQTPRITPRA